MKDMELSHDDFNIPCICLGLWPLVTLDAMRTEFMCFEELFSCSFVLNNIHLGMQQVNANGVQGFTGRYEGFSNYSNIEGLKINPDGSHEDATGAVKDRLDLVDIIKDKDAAVQAKYDVISENAQIIRNKLYKLDSHDGSGNDIWENINDKYDSKNNIIPFMFDASNGATDF